MFRIELRRCLRRFEVERKPLLNSTHSATLSKIKEQCEIENDRRRQDRITTKEINLYLHRITQPAEDIDVVPTFLIVAAWRVIVDSDHMGKVFIKVRVNLWLKDVFKYCELGLFLGFKGIRIIEHLTIAVAENISRVPTMQT